MHIFAIVVRNYPYVLPSDRDIFRNKIVHIGLYRPCNLDRPIFRLLECKPHNIVRDIFQGNGLVIDLGNKYLVTLTLNRNDGISMLLKPW